MAQLAQKGGKTGTVCAASLQKHQKLMMGYSIYIPARTTISAFALFLAVLAQTVFELKMVRGEMEYPLPSQSLQLLKI